MNLSELCGTVHLFEIGSLKAFGPIMMFTALSTDLNQLLVNRQEPSLIFKPAFKFEKSIILSFHSNDNFRLFLELG